jgi:hypothetical protein
LTRAENYQAALQGADGAFTMTATTAKVVIFEAFVNVPFMR